MIREANGNGERFCFILGSGASVESGIPSGNTLEMRWMDCLMGEAEDSGTPAMDPGETERIAGLLYDEKKIEHEFRVIREAWQRAKSQGGQISSEYYFDIYTLRFYPNPRNGYSYLEKIMEHCAPSLGYHTLAKLLTENNLNNLVITTNFDSLVEDALFLYTDKKPLVVSHESLADYMEANIQRPIVAKVHRGLMYAPFNSPETTHSLRPEWRQALSHAFGTYTPIVIGYAGGDRSLMAFLEEESTTMRNKVYWCYRGKIGQPKLPEENIQKFVQDKGGCLVAIDGFDALMVEIGKTLYGNAIQPDYAAGKLKEKDDERIQRYNEQWNKLNGEPEHKEPPQPVTGEQQRQEQREEEKLTYVDYTRRGDLARKEGRRDDAIREYGEAIKKAPKKTAAYNNRGIVYDDMGEYAKAIEDYNTAIGLNPNYAHAYNNRGVAYKNIGDCGKAIADYGKAIELNPDYAIAYNNRGAAYKDQGDLQKAIADYSKAIELKSDYVWAYNNRGIAYDDLKEYEKAIADYSRAIEMDPNDASIYYNRGIAYKNRGDREKAIADYSKAIELDPNYTFAYNNRGIAYDDLKEYEKAIADYSRAIELNPDYVLAYNNRGVSYKNLKEYEKAIADYSRAIELNPQYKLAYRNRAKAYRAIGEDGLAEADESTAAEL